MNALYCIFVSSYCVVVFRSFWADFLTADPRAWKIRVGEHNMFEDDATQVDVPVEKIIFHPQRHRNYEMSSLGCLGMFNLQF